MILGGEEMEVRRKMELFDKRFVYLEWDDKLEGKKVFIGDTLPQLRVSVNGHCDSLQEVSKNISDDSFYPFISPCGTRYAMAYYDQNYECKVAYAQGKVIQCRNKGDDNWIVTSNPNWVDRCEYRVKHEPEMWTTCIDDEGIVSVMPACAWNKDKGRQLIEGTEEKCKDFAIGNYCDKCARNASCAHQWLICDDKTLDTATRIDAWYCQGFIELKAIKKEEHKLRVYKCSDDTLHVSPYCIMTDFLFEGTEEECKQYIKEHYCDKCFHQMCSINVNTQFCNGFKPALMSMLYVHESTDHVLRIDTHTAHMWYKFEGTEKECEQYIKEHYCNKCIHKSCEMKVDCQFCQGFKESVSKPDESKEVVRCNPSSQVTKKNRRMTNRELARWLAEGNGQARDTRTVFTFTYYNVYAVCDDDKPCPSYLAIRGWDSDEWMEPEVKE